jgi:NADH dehydrogenase FAD-containing subunit
MKRVIVIGGGFCGASIARELQKEFEVILVDDKPYFEFTPGVLRVAVEPSEAQRLRVMHLNYLTKGRVERGKVKAVEDKSIRVGTHNVPYDYLVICSGAKYNSTNSKEMGIIPAYRGDDLEKHAEELLKAGHVLIIGGGLVGVELAAEICSRHPYKKITLVDAGSRIMERNNEKTSRYAEAFLRRHNVEIVGGEKIAKKEKGIFFTDKGTRIVADLVFGCVGMKANAPFMHAAALDERGSIKVDEFLRVEGKKNIFAGGDVTNIREEKTAQVAEEHARIIVKNIRAIEHEKSLVAYTPKRKPMLVSLGTWNGIYEKGNRVMTGVVPAMIKMYVEKRTLSKYR